METIDDTERVPSTCQICHQDFGAAVMRSPFNPGKVLFQAQYCDPCIINRQAIERDKAWTQAQNERQMARRGAWDALCPMEFRLTGEGGRTDLGRLLSEFPILQQVIEHDLSIQGLIVRGKSGHGKTRAVWRLLRRSFDANKRIRAMASGEFDRQARDAGGKFTLTEFVDRLIEADVLFLDDLGKAPWTPATVGIWFDVLDGRYREGRPIVVTTNLDGAALCKQLRIGPDIGEPMLRRMRETTRQIVVKTT
jgi:hypothetical protein